MARRTFPPSSQQSTIQTIQFTVFLFPFPHHQNKASCHLFKTTLSSWMAARKRGDISRVSGCGLHSTAPSLIIDGVCARVILNPERSGACSLRAASSFAAAAAAAGQKASRCAWQSGWQSGLYCTYPARCAADGPRPFEMMGHDWVAATRVHLFVQPGVPPLLFVSEGRWGPQGHLPQGWET